MRIAGIKIDGFGFFCNANVQDLPPGLLLFQGNNEAGKSTLLAFIRNMLFGFPDRRSKENAYPNLRGGHYGGYLLLERAAGERLVMERRPGKNGGVVTVVDFQNRRGGEELLRPLLGSVTKELYKNIYAFSLTELQALETLQEEAARSIMYGAGSGITLQALVRTREAIDKGLAERFKPDGIKPGMNAKLTQLKEIQVARQQAAAQAGQFDVLSLEQEGAGQKTDQEQEKLGRLRKQSEQRANFLKVWTDWQEFQEAERKIHTLRSQVSTFPEDGLDRLGQFQSGQRQREADRAQAEREVQDLRQEMGNLRVDETLLQRANEILRLREVSGAGDLISRHQQEMERIKIQRLRAEEKLSVKQEEWKNLLAAAEEVPSKTPETVPGKGEGIDLLRKNRESVLELRELVQNTASLAGDLRHQQERLQDRKQELTRINRTAAAQHLSRLLQRMAAGAGGCGIAAWAVLFFLHQRTAAWLAGIILLGAAAVFFWFFRTLYQAGSPLVHSEHRSVETQAADLEKSIAGLTAKKDGLNTRIRDLSLSLELRGVLTMEVLSRTESKIIGKIERFTQRRQLTGDLAAAGEEYRRAQEVEQTTAAAWREWLGEQGLDPSLTPETCREMLHQVAECQVRKEELLKQIQKLQQKAEGWGKITAEAAEQIRHLVQEGNAEDEADFTKRGLLYAEQQRLRTAVAEMEKNILKITGQNSLAAVKDILRMVSLPDLQAQAADLSRQQDESEKAVDQLRQVRADLGHRLAQLASADVVSRLRCEEEKIVADISQLSREWSSLAMARYLLCGAQRKFAQEQQPAVVKNASGFLKVLTGGKYDNIIAPLGSDTVEVTTPDGATHLPGELSRGTAEQLYLSLRFGYLTNHRVGGGETLPVVMDDILVNFDPVRTRQAVQAILQLSQTHQVLFFTCHPSVVSVFQSAQPIVPCYQITDFNFRRVS
jgi:uncharacterized protein YhaN